VSREEFERLAKVLADAKAHFVIPPETRHSGTGKEKFTMFVLDSFGNGIEFKSLFEPANLFKKHHPNTAVKHCRQASALLVAIIAP